MAVHNSEAHLEADAGRTAPRTPPASSTAVPNATLAAPVHQGLLGCREWAEWPLASLDSPACAWGGSPLLCLRGRLQKGSGLLLQGHLQDNSVCDVALVQSFAQRCQTCRISLSQMSEKADCWSILLLTGTRKYMCVSVLCLPREGYLRSYRLARMNTSLSTSLEVELVSLTLVHTCDLKMDASCDI